MSFVNTVNSINANAAAYAPAAINGLPLLGRVFGWGTVVVRGTGGGVFALQFLENA